MTETQEYLKAIYGECIKLVVEGTTTGSEMTSAYIVLFREENGRRLFPALLNKTDFMAVNEAMGRGHYPTVALTAKVCSAIGMKLHGVRLQFPDKGRFEAFMDFVDAAGSRHIMIKGSLAEAVCLALLMNRPIVTRPVNLGGNTSDVGRHQRIALPLPAMSREILEEALQQCVAQDNFEQASAIRDELKRRSLTND